MSGRVSLTPRLSVESRLAGGVSQFRADKTLAFAGRQANELLLSFDPFPKGLTLHSAPAANTHTVQDGSCGPPDNRIDIAGTVDLSLNHQ